MKKKASRAFGLSLIEVLVTVCLLSILFTGAYGLAGTKKKAMRRIKENNMAMYALESLRNRILADVMRDFTFDVKKAELYIKDMYLPFTVTAETVVPSEFRDGRKILRLKMKVPTTNDAIGRIYVREVVLP